MKEEKFLNLRICQYGPGKTNQCEAGCSRQNQISSTIERDKRCVREGQGNARKVPVSFDSCKCLSQLFPKSKSMKLFFYIPCPIFSLEHLLCHVENISTSLFCDGYIINF